MLEAPRFIRVIRGLFLQPILNCTALGFTRGAEFQLPLLGHSGAISFHARKGQQTVKIVPLHVAADKIFLNALKFQYTAIDMRNVPPAAGDLALKVQIDQTVIGDGNRWNHCKLEFPGGWVKVNLPCCQQGPIGQLQQQIPVNIGLADML